MRAGFKLLAVCAFVAVSSGVHAATITPTGNGLLTTTQTNGNINANTDNVFFDNVDNATLFQGSLGSQNSPQIVFFNSFGIEVDAKNGFAAAPSDGAQLITHLQITVLPGFGFSYLQFQPDGATAFNIVASNGGSSQVTNVDSNDNQFLSVRTGNGALLTQIDIYATGGGFKVFKQFELDYIRAPGNQVGDVPETTTWAMMMLGFAGLGFMGYRRRSRKLGVAFAAK